MFQCGLIVMVLCIITGCAWFGSDNGDSPPAESTAVTPATRADIDAVVAESHEKIAVSIENISLDVADTRSEMRSKMEASTTNVNNLTAAVNTVVTTISTLRDDTVAGHRALAGLQPNEPLNLNTGLRRRLESLPDDTAGVVVRNLRTGIRDEIKDSVREVLDDRDRAKKEAAKEAELEAFKAKEQQLKEDDRMRRLIRGELQSQYDNLDDSVDKLTTAISTSSEVTTGLKTTIETEFREVRQRLDKQETFEARKEVIEQWLKAVSAGYGIRAVEGLPPPNVRTQYVHERFIWPGCRVETYCNPRSKVLFWQCHRY
ncbi:MAG: hypothetical protein WD972_03415 [Candidatus Andersenbacteria bacterium]